MWLRDLTTLECKRVLDENRLARLACSNEGRPYIVPIYYAHADHSLYAFSMLGKKIEWMRANPIVSALIEEHYTRRGWKSVIVDGRYEELPDTDGYRAKRERAWSLLSKHADWWEPGALRMAQPAASDQSSPIFYRILIEQLSGREAH